MLELKNLCFSYGQRPVIQNLSLSLGDGERLLLTGPSGCGKSTLLALIAGLLQPDSGSIRCDARIALCFQDLRLLPQLDALHNVNAVLSDRARTLPEAKRWLEEAGLEECATLRPDRLSGGQARRLALVRTLAAPSGLLLLDEPFSALDAQTRRRMLALTDRTAQGKALLLVSHDRGDGEALGAKILEWA